MQNLRALSILFVANFISGVAQGISMLAIPWYFARSEDMATFGIIFLLTNCVSLLWMPYAGVLVDRYNRKGILLLMSVTGFAVMGASAVSGLTREVPVWVAAIAFMYTFFHFNIHYTNLYAFVQEITEERHYARITSAMEVIHQLTTMLAGAAGAMLLEGTPDGILNVFGVHVQTPWHIQAWDLHEIFALDAGTYLIALIILWIIKYIPIKERYHEAGHVLSRLHTGWRYLNTHRPILIFGAASFCVFVTIIVIGFYLNPTYVFNHLGESADVFAASEMYYALGAVAAGAGTLAVFRKWSIPNAVICLTMIAAIMYGVQAATHSVALFYLAVLAMGLSNAGTRVLRTTYLMHEIPNQVYGRTNGIFNMINVLMRIFFMLIFAIPFLADSNHVIYTFIVTSVFLVAASVVMFWIKPRLHKR
ncbi:MAG TPA: MFS transporter [Saprospiraceae bacterium]|nr:MFS transporter [Saprospiraceae bacterium]